VRILTAYTWVLLALCTVVRSRHETIVRNSESPQFVVCDQQPPAEQLSSVLVDRIPPDEVVSVSPSPNQLHTNIGLQKKSLNLPPKKRSQIYNFKCQGIRQKRY
jgi:hypothetical protein